MLWLHKGIIFGFCRSNYVFTIKESILYQASVRGHLLHAPLGLKCRLMLEDQWFAILRAFHYSKLLFDKIRTDHIYKGDEAYGPCDQNPNRGEET